MRAAYALDTAGGAGEATFRASFPATVPATTLVDAPSVAERPVYGERDGPNWTAIVTIASVHVLLLVALVKFDVIEIGHKAAPPLVVELLADQPPPLPPPSAIEPEVAPVKPVQPQIVAPPPLVQTPAPPPQVATVAEAPPPQAAIVAPAAPKAAVAAPVAVDLSTKMIAGKPPRYPVDSRRNKEQGTVVLRLTLGLDGSVSEIGVAHSSGFDRLDKAALEAVRRWRWSPTVQAGQAVQVRGMVEIPFVLQG